MANQEHLEILKQGINTWNQWRMEHSDIQPNLSQANLSDTILSKINFNDTILSGADLRRADLRKADFRRANLNATNLSSANLQGADLSEASLIAADLSGADLQETKLIGTLLLNTNLAKATLINCLIYGVSAWNIYLQDTIQANLIITPVSEPKITVDNLEVAQFIYLLLNNPKIRDIIDTITSKVVLILGRFTPERKAILDALRAELRKLDYSPVLFDFEKPSNRDITETISTLAYLSRFIIADITDGRSIARDLQLIVPHLVVPVQPLLQSSEREYGTFSEFRRYPWVLPTYLYKDAADLLTSLRENIIYPAEAKVKELQQIKAEIFNV